MCLGDEGPRCEVLEPTTPAALGVVAIRRTLKSCTKVAVPSGVKRPGHVLGRDGPVADGVLGADDPRKAQPGGGQMEEASSLTPRPVSLGVRTSTKKVYWKLFLSSG